jgi:hypothetical protein
MSIATHERAAAPDVSGECPKTSRRRPAPIRAAPRSAAAGPWYRVMFVVPFQTRMSDAGIHRLNRVLDMTTHLHPKLHASPASPGVSRLDFFSGLFLLRGAGSADWQLEGRTWRTRAPESVHDWHLAAADAARLLAPAVPVPSRLETAET